MESTARLLPVRFPKQSCACPVSLCGGSAPSMIDLAAKNWRSNARMAPSLKLRAPIQHVIFDLDGVLLDTEPIYTEVTHVITSRFGKAFDWSVKANMLGRPAMDSAEYLIA